MRFSSRTTRRMPWQRSSRSGGRAGRLPEQGWQVAFALSATTGAGKTVMATAVFEALSRDRKNSTSRLTRARSSCG